ncbi:uncharacterized protein LOC123266458 isoform X2 [Cotesia glomerata]|uniref:uncharacterized protein LOC123266458 isoform X2 n=1 Tax=Cotesia glomerata TaxID=32391 RepID=UPI001D02FB90|nr:uncharacterized protein LOC123266458 isoform X2 [Cotesia glomerata]
MNFHNSFSTLVWMFIIVKLNVSFVVSTIVPFQNGDARDWREAGDDANLAKINSFHTIIIDEEKLNFKHYCTGKCETLTSYGKFGAMTSKYPNDCRGMLIRCWFHEETQKRKDAQSNYDSVVYSDRLAASLTLSSSNIKIVKKAHDRLDHTGNLCKCLCYRIFDQDSSDPNDKREKLIENLCLDPVSADKDHVVTGVRFKRYDNTIYLELQQAKFINNRIVTTPQWKTSLYCQNSISLANESFWGLKENFNIIAEDLILPEDAVVTGVTLGQSLRGRYINENGNFDKNRKEFTKATQCVTKCPDNLNELCKFSKRPSFRNADSSDENPRVSTATKGNYERSESCKTRIYFRLISATENDMQNIVPYLDLQEVASNPAEPIRGVGWYHRGFPGYGGFLALKIFKKV